MSDLLLQTKLFTPTLRSSLITRTHLIDRLNAGLGLGTKGFAARLALVCAPAGFGKTTLVCAWLAQLAVKNGSTSETLTAWLSLDDNDNDPVRFLAYLTAALQTAVPHLGQMATQALQSPQPPPMETILTLLINEINQHDQPIILVLDDYHVITTPAIHQVLAFLLEHLPPQLHLLLTSRSDPPLPLSRLRSRGQVMEIRANNLRFTSAEVSQFFNQVMNFTLSDEEMVVLEEQTEGWIAGLQLAALSLQGHSDIPAFIASFSGNSRYIMDYLIDEVLQQRPSGSEQFLMQTAVLDRFCAPLCDCITDQPNSQMLLEQLEAANLFLIPLDDRRTWYRYHHLFADVLRNRLEHLQPALVPQIYQRASVWCEQNQLLMEAVEYAWRAADFDRFADLVEQYGPMLSFRGQMSTVLIWLNALPEAMKQARPSLYVYHAAVLTFTNQLEKVEECLQQAENALSDKTPPELAQIVLGQVDVIRGHRCRVMGDLVSCFAYAQQAVARLPEIEYTPLKLRAVAWLDIVRGFRWDGDVRPEKEALALSVRQPIREAGNSFALLNSITNLAFLQTLQGRLRQARSTYRETLALVTIPEQMQYLFGGASYFFGLGDLLREQNELAEAAVLLTQGERLVLGTIGADADIVTHGYMALAQLQQCQGDGEAAIATLNNLVDLGQQRHFADHLLTRGAAAQARLWLAQNNLSAAAAWADNYQLNATDMVDFPHEFHTLVLVRIRLAQRKLAGLRPLLEQLFATAAAYYRNRSVIEILILKALVEQADHNLPAALNNLTQALTLAEPEGFIRLFVDEGPAMADLLRQARLKGLFTNYASQLLAIFDAADSPQAAADLLPEPLSERELEVLHLAATGATNKEIAEQLFITVATAKKHVSNILVKLDTPNRTQAAVRARELGLLP